MSTAESQDPGKEKLDPAPPCRTNYYKSEPAVELHWHRLVSHSFSVSAGSEEPGRKESKLILLVEF